MDDFLTAVLAECQDLGTIFIFVSKEDEVDTIQIISHLLSEGKNVIVPVSDTTSGSIIPVQLISLDQLQASTFGIPEPIDREPYPVENIDLFFVPGRAFDESGNRKGRGKGYFDRFLKQIRGKKRIVGLCYENQMNKSLKPNPWDVPVDMVIAKSRSDNAG